MSGNLPIAFDREYASPNIGIHPGGLDHEAETVSSTHPNLTTTTKVPREWMQHLLVNAIGDYYDIDPLCQLASSTIAARLKRASWSVDEFIAFLTPAFRRTGDAGLHKLLGYTAAQHMDEVVENKAFNDLEEVSSAFTTAALRHCAHRFKALQELVRATEQKVQANDRKFRAHLHREMDFDKAEAASLACEMRRIVDRHLLRRNTHQDITLRHWSE